MNKYTEPSAEKVAFNKRNAMTNLLIARNVDLQNGEAYNIAAKPKDPSRRKKQRLA